MKIYGWAIAALVFGLTLGSNPTRATADEFFAGKTLTFIVGYRAGGGYDTYTRALARHLGKHIPGNPGAVVENKTGAGSMIAANFVYNKADPDGLSIGVFGGGLMTQQALGSKGVRFDGRKFSWMGGMAAGSPACAIMGFTGLKTLDDVLKSKKQLKIGSTGPGSTTDDLPKLMMGLMGANFNVIRGYKGTAGIRVAMQRKEVDGACWTWDSMRVTGRSMLDAKGDNKLIPYVIEGKFDEPEVKDLPQFMDSVKGDENLAAVKAWLAPYKFLRPLALPPNVPKDRLEILRTGLKKTMEDPQFVADVKKSKLDMSYISGQDVEKYVADALDIPPGAKEKLISLIGSKKK